MDTAKAFGKALRLRRKDAGLTQEQLGFESELRRTYISSLELGEKQPSLSTIFKLAHALKMSASVQVADTEANIKSNTKST
jgi:transcriptional regulator with XRE-family HTH domain